MLIIDGSFGEGGGQILRSALALSMVTRTPFKIENIRGNRKKPGLRRQHLTAVRAAGEVSGAVVEGAAVGSMMLSFEPGEVMPGDYHFDIGTAGSTTLVLQTVLPALLCGDQPSNISLEGGTHNPFAPTFDFLAKAFLPLVSRTGPTVIATLHQPGYYPAGGGRFEVAVEPAAELTALELIERGQVKRRCATASVASLPRTIAERELRVIQEETGWEDSALRIEEIETSRSPGNTVTIEIETEQLTEVFTAIGQIGVAAEAVAEQAVRPYQRYDRAEVPVGEHLADQLLLPMAIAGRGAFKTLPLSRHATTHIDLIRMFLDINVNVEQQSEHAHLVQIR